MLSIEDGRCKDALPELDDLLPEGDLPRAEQGVFAGVPAEEMRSFGVGRVVRASGPDFVEKEETEIIKGMMQIILQAAFLFAGGREERANLCFEQ